MNNLSSQSGLNENKSVARILIVGLGQLGLPVAKYVKEGGFETNG